jgi:chaperonin cofactor prefoldin
MSSLLERIAARRTKLTEQAQHLTKQLTDVQHELDRVSVAEQVITQMLTEPEPVDRDMSAPATSTATSASSGSGSAIIPYRRQVSGADELPADTSCSCRP